MKLQTVLFLFFFQILRFEIGGAAYLWMRLIHGRLRYVILLVIILLDYFFRPEALFDNKSIITCLSFHHQ